MNIRYNHRTLTDGRCHTFYRSGSHVADRIDARALERGCQEYGIRLEYRPPLRPNFGGHIERLIGTIMNAVHSLPGTTFSSVKERGEYDSQGKAIMTVRELEIWLTLQITGGYHLAVHRGLRARPIDSWKESVNTERTRHPRDPERFYIDFLPFAHRLIRRDGIQLESVRRPGVRSA